jgi:hypothetical protein
MCARARTLRLATDRRLTMMPEISHLWRAPGRVRALRDRVERARDRPSPLDAGLETPAVHEPERPTRVAASQPGSGPTRPRSLPDSRVNEACPSSTLSPPPTRTPRTQWPAWAAPPTAAARPCRAEQLRRHEGEDPLHLSASSRAGGDVNMRNRSSRCATTGARPGRVGADRTMSLFRPHEPRLTETMRAWAGFRSEREP